MDALGKHLKKQREEKGITLQSIEQVTKINQAYLRALEKDQYHFLPAPIFTIGFLKQYAQCIGLDEEDVILRYRAALQARGELNQDQLAESSMNVRKRSLFIVAATIAFLILVWLFLYQGNGSKEERVRAVRIPGPTPEELKKEALRKELNITENPSLNNKPAGQRLSSDNNISGDGVDIKSTVSSAKAPPVEVILQAIHETWVQVELDDKPPFPITMKTGERFVCQALEKIRLKIGSGNGVRIFYKGKAYEKLGGKADVVHITFPP